MRSFSLLVVFLLLGSALSSTIQTSPVFLWSNTNFFNAKNLQIVSLTTVEDIYNAFSNKGSLSSHVSHKNSLEAIVLFVEPELKTEEVSRLAGAYSSNPNGGVFSIIKDYVESSLSSLVAPYVMSTSDDGLIGGQLYSLFQKSSGKVYYLENKNKNIKDGKIIHMTPSQFMSSNVDLKTETTDLIIVKLDGDFEEDNKLVRKICSSISTSSFVAIYSAEKLSPLSIQKRYPQSHESLSTFESEFAQSAAVPIIYIPLAIWNDQIVTALILAIPLLLILFVGTRCLFELQSELKFESLAKKKNN